MGCIHFTVDHLQKNGTEFGVLRHIFECLLTVEDDFGVAGIERTEIAAFQIHKEQFTRIHNIAGP